MKGWNIQGIVSWGLQLVVAGILLQTLFFKFTGAAESVYIFSTLGVEPWGRILSGIVELVAAILLLVPATTTVGAVLALAVMAGAIGSHLTRSRHRNHGRRRPVVRAGADRLRLLCGNPRPPAQ